MGIDLYYLSLSAPCRSVMLLAKELGVELNLKNTNLFEGEHMKPEFLAMNPQHTIPTLDDNGFVLWESRAILQYLANQYGKDDSLYPKDPKKRAIVDQRLYFDIGTLFVRFRNYFYPVFFANQPHFLKSNMALVEDALGWLDGFIEKSGGWVAGPNKTIADYALVASVSTMETLPAEHLDLSKYKHITEWLAKCKAEFKDYEEANGEGAKAWGGAFFEARSAGKTIV